MLIKRVKDFCIQKTMLKSLKELVLAVNGTDEWKYLAWTNSEIDRVNLEVRRRIYEPSQQS
jgi:hypothetical protein